MQCFARAAPNSEVRELHGVLLTNAAVESPVFNAAFLLRAVADDPVELDRRVAIAKVYYAAHGLDWSFWICEDLLPSALRRKAAGILERRGLRTVTVCPGMIADRLEPPSQQCPRIDCRPVADAETRLAFCHITSICFRIPFGTSLAIYDSPATWDSGFTAYIGYRDGVPLATAATLEAGGVIGLYSVATLPEYQGRGIGEAITRYAVGRARESSSCRRIVLQATRQGGALYRRLGFREVTRISVYAST